ncbi:VOC family protein [Roseococcus sp. SYP-B2431]|uniref:VOC family protein n=1 Tax=Roseococcus sp. SYP-B2431 TaxID=2496640 RepID=UPI00103E9DFB|nr:VOC family protein [Roseococcus sp. SYP-B2431]TCH97957.1 VOC family protein [Roseococcus sp. SYP-B2431]
MAETALALDHVGVCNMELGPMTAAYEALGFSLSPVAQQSGRRTPESEVELYGSGNRCAFLTHGYIELLAVLDPTRFDNDLARFTGRYGGVHILALGMDDAEANLARMRRAGIPIAGVAHLQRPVEAGGPIAKFSRLPYPDAPEGRIQLIRHLTPELVWQKRWMDHANKAEALTELVLVSAEPAVTAARLSKLTGIVIEPRLAGGFLLRLPGGARVAGPEAPVIETRVSILAPEDLEATLPGVVIPALPFMAGIFVKTSDGNAAVRKLLAGKRATDLPGGALLVPPALAAGAALVFHP